MIGTFYRIHYCDLDGRDVPVYKAKIYRVFSLNKHIRDFPYLSAANEWIKREAEKRDSFYGA
jgi:hypothetical protein